MTLEVVPRGSRVLDLGCAGGYMALTLKAQRECRVAGVDFYPLPPGVEIDSFYQHDLNDGPPAIDMRDIDVVLMLDVIEHLPCPEAFIERLCKALEHSPDVKIIVSTGNIGFVVTRLTLLLGQFNYGKRGILDLTHCRLFTFASLRRLFEQNGFRVLESRGVSAPYPLAVGGRLGRLLLGINQLLIRVSKRVFSYQIFIVAQPRPTLEYLLEKAETQSALR
jgi:2-polyprenyl-3-methyl-5-hydroxy-6-metoxy-1,4-benzoquinol methylase